MTLLFETLPGFGELDHQRRLRLLDLKPADQVWVGILQDRVIGPNLTALVDAFYARFEEQSELMDVVTRAGATIDQLKRTHGVYLRSFGRDFDATAYGYDRLRVGLVHAKVGVDLSTYICSCRILEQLILDAIPADIVADILTLRGMSTFISRLMALDMSLAIDAYHLNKVGTLEKTLQHLRSIDSDLRRQMATDFLTGAASQAYAHRLLRVALWRAQRRQLPLCVSMVDLDFFKQINDCYGHKVGDGVLRGVVSRMRSAVRDFDVVGRCGGEEFIVIFHDTSRETARQIAERVRVHVSSTPLQVGVHKTHITLSQGVAEYRLGDTADALVARADKALYHAKSLGRNCVMTASN